MHYPDESDSRDDNQSECSLHYKPRVSSSSSIPLDVPLPQSKQYLRFFIWSQSCTARWEVSRGVDPK